MFKGLIILIPSKPILGTLVLILLFSNLCFAQPTFTNQGDVLAFLNDGPQSIENWASVNSGTPPFNFTTNINSTTGTIAFDTPPSISADGTLSF